MANGTGKAEGGVIKENYKKLKIKWVGRRYYGLASFIDDANAGICSTHKYQYSTVQHNNRWFSIEDFIKHYK
jgi:hypothetical protein